MDWRQIGQAIVDVLVLTANGLLVVLYWIRDHLPVVLSWPLAATVTVLLDSSVVRKAGHRARRYGRGQLQQASWTSYLFTPLLAVFWTVVALVAPAPIPSIGLGMWTCLLIAPLMIAPERDHLLQRLRWFIAVYAVATTGFLILLRSRLSAAALAGWSRALGEAGGGEALAGLIFSSIVPWAAVLLWVILPLTYFGYVAQRFAMNWRTKVSPWDTIERRIARLRGRGEEV